MLSIANVRSPSAAASYFADDNYYARADADPVHAHTLAGHASRREDLGTCAIRNSIWSARMRRLRKMKSSHRLGT